LPVPINPELLKSLIEGRFGSVDDFAVAWGERVEEKRQCRGNARDRNTIYRWLNNGIPSRVDDLFGICGALDIDPVTLLPWDQDFIERQFAKERLRIQINPSRRTDLAPFDAIFLPGVHWPTNEVANCFYGRSWTVEVREHTPSVVSGVYAAFELSVNADQATPLAFHFAWRRTDARDQMWRPYGSVVRYSDRTLLVSESGDLQSVSVKNAGDSTVVETFFGAGPAMFKIASIHSFSLSVQVPSQAPQAVRFKA